MAVSEEGMRKLLKLFAEDGSQEAIEAALRHLMRETDRPGGPKGQPSEQAKEVISAYEVFLAQHEFSAGQLVRWKPGMKNRRRPATNQPAIVLEVLSEPVFDTSPTDSSAGTPYFREPLDIVLGLVDVDGDFIVFHYDSRRLEPFPEHELR